MKKTPPAFAGVIVLWLSIFIAYCNSFHGDFIFDDSGSIHENESIRKLSTGFFPEGNSGNTVSGRPVLNFTFAIDYALHGESVTGYHVANLLIHLLAAAAVFGLARRTFLLPKLRGWFGESAWWLALVIALLWGLHPLQTESVTYIVQRAESLVGLFFWVTLYCFVRSVEQEANRWWRVATVFTCLLGMGSKEVMAGAPLIVLLFDRTFVAGDFLGALRQRRWFYIALASTWLLLGLCIWWTGQRGSTVGYSAFASWWRYGITQCFAIIHYLKLVFWPSPLVLDYGKTLACDFNDAGIQTFAVAGIGAYGLWAVWRKPTAGFLIALFFVVLAPSSSVVPVLTQTLAEHRMYLAVGAVVALVVASAFKRFGSWTLPVFLVVAVLLGGLTFRRNAEYRTEESIWRTVTERCPLNQRGWGALSTIYAKRGDFKKAKEIAAHGLKYLPTDVDALSSYARILCKLEEQVEAEQVFKYALDLQPWNYDLLCGYGTLLIDLGRPTEALEKFTLAEKFLKKPTEAYYGKGKALVELGRLEESIPEFKKVLELDPKTIDARNNLGNVYINLKQLPQALAVLQEAQKILPSSNDIGRTLGLAYLSAGRFDDAIKVLEEVLKRSPKDAKAHANLALVFATQGRSADATAHYEAVLNETSGLKSDFVRAVCVSAAVECIKLGNYDQALVHYEKALESSPNDLGLKYLHANLLLQLGDLSKAVPELEKVVAEAAGNADALNDLGVAYLQAGRANDARKQFLAALAIKPDHLSARENLSKAEAFSH